MQVEESLRDERQPAPGVLPVLRSLAEGIGNFELGTMAPQVIDHALQMGLGPVLARIAAGVDGAGPHAERIRAADLTARLLTAEKYAALADLLAAAADCDCRIVLLKGCATALRYYPEPYLRTMGDIDVLVPAERQEALEARLAAYGFRQRSHKPSETFVGRHHGMPFWHQERHVWVDVHSRLHPRQFPLADDDSFSPAAVASELSPIAIGQRTAYTLSHELQLIYTSARAAERFDAERGVYPILDAALLIRLHAATLDWDRVLAAAGTSWAATALRVMLCYLERCDLAPVPPHALRALAARDRHVNRLSMRLLHRLITRQVMEGRPFVVGMSRGRMNLLWGTLLQPQPPVLNLISLPYRLAQFSPANAVRRLREFSRRTSAKG